LAIFAAIRPTQSKIRRTSVPLLRGILLGDEAHIRVQSWT
jgi:hypothetical protein